MVRLDCRGLLFLATLGLLIGGCPTPPTAGGVSVACSSDAECADLEPIYGQAFRCDTEAGLCVAGAACPSACPRSTICVNGTCQAEICDPPCADTESCVDHRCVANECDPPCAESETCVGGECVAPFCVPACSDSEVCVEGTCQPAFTDPSIEILTPSPGATVDAQLELELRVDPGGRPGPIVECRVDGQDIRATATPVTDPAGDTWACSLDLTSVADGPVTVTASLSFQNDPTTREVSVDLDLDGTAPDIRLELVQGDAALPIVGGHRYPWPGDLILQATIREPHLDESSLTLFSSAALFGPFSCTDGATASERICSASTTLPRDASPGDVTLEVAASDLLGHSATASIDFTIDDRPPVLGTDVSCGPADAASQTASGALRRDAKIACQVDLSDAETAVAQATVEIVDPAASSTSSSCTVSLSESSPGVWSGVADHALCAFPHLTAEVRAMLDAKDVWGNHLGWTEVGRFSVSRELWRTRPGQGEMLSPTLFGGTLYATQARPGSGTIYTFDPQTGTSTALNTGSDIVVSSPIVETVAGDTYLHYLARWSTTDPRRYVQLAKLIGTTTSNIQRVPTSASSTMRAGGLPVLAGTWLRLVPLVSNADALSLRGYSIDGSCNPSIPVSGAMGSSAWLTGETASLLGVSTEVVGILTPRGGVYHVGCTCSLGCSMLAANTGRTGLGATFGPVAHAAASGPEVLVARTIEVSPGGLVKDVVERHTLSLRNASVTTTELFPFSTITAPVVHDDTDVYIADHSASVPGLLVRSIAGSGTPVRIATGAEVRSIALGVAADGVSRVAYVVLGDQANGAYDLAALDMNTGDTLWTGNVGDGMNGLVNDPHALLLDDGGVLYLPVGQELIAVLTDGQGPAPGWPMWRGTPARTGWIP